jgi:hypothetical protein
MKKVYTSIIIALLLTGTAKAQFSVEWDSLKNLVVVGDGLKKTGGHFWGGTAISVNELAANRDGSVGITIDALNKVRMFGLTSATVVVDYKNLDYAIAFGGGSTIKVFEKGIELSAFGQYAVGDQFRVEKSGSVIYYKRNEQTFFSTQITALINLKIGVDIYADNALLTRFISSFNNITPESPIMWEFISGNTLGDPVYRYGKVAIGSMMVPEEYMLSVQGKVIVEGVKVELQSKWPDYVFDDSYQPLSLEEIQDFIDKNKHLPEIPSVKEVESDGIDLGEMNALLLKKIEELTLHLIHQNDEVKLLKKRVLELEKEK